MPGAWTTSRSATSMWTPTYLRVRNSIGQVASMVMVIASGVTSEGSTEILGCDIGDSESEGFWRPFLASLRDRGLTGVRA